MNNIFFDASDRENWFYTMGGIGKEYYDKIFIGNALCPAEWENVFRECGEVETIVGIIGHETIHLVLNKMQLRTASFDFDNLHPEQHKDSNASFIQKATSYTGVPNI